MCKELFLRVRNRVVSKIEKSVCFRRVDVLVGRIRLGIVNK